MKNLVMMLMIFSSLAVSAQRNISEKKESRKEMRTSYTPEQRASIMAKQMTLSLDLSQSQQKQVQELLLSKQKEKADKPNSKTMTPEQRFEMKNARLDRQIEIKREMKSILSPVQYAKWEESRKNSKHRGKRMHSKPSQEK